MHLLIDKRLVLMTARDVDVDGVLLGQAVTLATSALLGELAADANLF